MLIMLYKRGSLNVWKSILGFIKILVEFITLSSIFSQHCQTEDLSSLDICEMYQKLLIIIYSPYILEDSTVYDLYLFVP